MSRSPKLASRGFRKYPDRLSVYGGRTIGENPASHAQMAEKGSAIALTNLRGLITLVLTEGHSVVPGMSLGSAEAAVKTDYQFLDDEHHDDDDDQPHNAMEHTVELHEITESN